MDKEYRKEDFKEFLIVRVGKNDAVAVNFCEESNEVALTPTVSLVILAAIVEVLTNRFPENIQNKVEQLLLEGLPELAAARHDYITNTFLN